MNKTSLFSFIILCIFPFAETYCQVSASGPTCVVPGLTYQYSINGTWDSASTLQVCVSGGLIADTSASNSCTPNGAPLFSVLIIWKDTSNASLNIVSSSGNSTFHVTVTSPLVAGSVDTTTGTQMVGYDSIPATIHCAVDTGGSCSPSYSYQWQQSSDNVSWVDMAGSTGQNLDFYNSLAHTTYYRRRVTEIQSGSIAYSGTAAVFVNVQAASADSSQNDTTGSGFNKQQFWDPDRPHFSKANFRKKLHEFYRRMIKESLMRMPFRKEDQS